MRRGDQDSPPDGRSIAGSTGPLSLSWTGPPPGACGRVRCLLDGRVDGLDELAGSLGLRPAAPEDTLAAGYARLGEALLPRLRGEFAIVLWDARDGSGLVARDPLGARPLFVHRSGHRLVFASEVRALLRILPTRPGPDASALARWLDGDPPAGMATLYDGIERVEPGTFVRLGGPARARRYWAPSFREPLRLGPRDAAELVREGLRAAVARRLAGHDHVAVMLSGGLDSASLAALARPMAAGMGVRLTPCSVVFPEYPAVDESALIRLQRTRLGLPGIEQVVCGGSPLAAAQEHLARWELPLAPAGDFIWGPVVGAAADAGATALLDGEGGDELFGAEPDLVADRLRAGRPLEALRLARRYPGAGRSPGPRFLLGALRDFGLRPLLRPEADDAPDGPLWWQGLVHSLTVTPEAVGLFDYYRRRGHVAGLAAGHPFLDLDLVETVLRLPPELAFDPLFTRPLLREAVRGDVPDEVRLRRGKSFFDQLLADRLRQELPSLRGLLGPRAEVGAYVDRRSLAAALSDDAAARAPVAWTREVWRLATAETWLRAQSGESAPPFSDLDPAPAASSLAVRPCIRSRTLQWTTSSQR